jgi:endonuclease YncB( thermonuclease family)
MRHVLVLVLAIAACSQSSGGKRYDRKQAQKSLGKLEQPGLVVGEFKITSIVDGDTIHVNGLDSSLRLLGIDTEESYHNEEDRRCVEAGWEQCLKKKRGSSSRPVKMSTPLGDQAKTWAQKFFDGVTVVRIERDHPAEIRDRYNRYLAYVFAQKAGVWVNYNVEACRAGMAPYFDKYGRSRRFHDEFKKAEVEAKAAKRGIWATGVMSYPDYPEREAWWNARGDFVEEFRQAAVDKPNYIDITHWDSLEQLEKLAGKEVVMLGTVGDVRIGEKGPSTVTLSRRLGSDFPLIFFDRDVMGTSGIEAWKGEFVVVTGIPSFYENKHTHKKQLQIQVDHPTQIKLSKVPGLTVPTAGSAPP